MKEAKITSPFLGSANFPIFAGRRPTLAGTWLPCFPVAKCKQGGGREFSIRLTRASWRTAGLPGFPIRLFVLAGSTSSGGNFRQVT